MIFARLANSRLISVPTSADLLVTLIVSWLYSLKVADVLQYKLLSTSEARSTSTGILVPLETLAAF